MNRPLRCDELGCRGRGPKWLVSLRDPNVAGPPSNYQEVYCDRHLLSSLALVPRLIMKIEAIL